MFNVSSTQEIRWLAKRYYEDRDNDRKAAGRWNATLRINSVLWTNGASCNRYLWILSNLSQQTPLSVSANHFFCGQIPSIPSISFYKGKAVGRGWYSHRSTLLVARVPGWHWSHHPVWSVRAILFHSNGFPLHQLYLTTPSGEQECAWCWCCPACSEVTENKAMSQLATGTLSFFENWLLELEIHVRLPGQRLFSHFLLWEGIIESQSKYVFKSKGLLCFQIKNRTWVNLLSRSFPSDSTRAWNTSLEFGDLTTGQCCVYTAAWANQSFFCCCEATICSKSNSLTHFWHTFRLRFKTHTLLRLCLLLTEKMPPLLWMSHLNVQIAPEEDGMENPGVYSLDLNAFMLSIFWGVFLNSLFISKDTTFWEAKDFFSSNHQEWSFSRRMSPASVCFEFPTPDSFLKLLRHQQ